MKIVGKFFAFIFSFIYCLVLTSFITISYSTNLLKGEFYTQILNKVDFNEIEIKVDNGQGEITEVPLKDLLVNGLTQTGMDEDTAVKIIENENINRIVGNLVGDIMNYQLNKGDIPEVSKEDIKSIVNDPDINKDNATLSDEEINELQETINSFLNQMLLEGGFNNADTR
jgi:hypothetical protein